MTVSIKTIRAQVVQVWLLGPGGVAMTLIEGVALLAVCGAVVGMSTTTRAA